MKSTSLFILAMFVAIAGLVGAAAAAPSSAGLSAPGGSLRPLPTEIAAASRCNSRTINDYQSQIRNYDAHPPKNDPVDLNKRLGEIVDILGALNEEHNILDNICPDDSKPPLFAELNSTIAWALALQSDIAAELNASCPPAAKALPAAMLAQAWLALAATVNDAGGTVPKSVAEVLPKVQSRAAAVGLALPVYSETSAYWRDQVTEQARQAAAACPTPVPPPATPTPSPYPSPPPE